jgi:hypothetical protein
MTQSTETTSKPTVAYVVDFWVKATDAWEYHGGYYPEWNDGYATYYNEAAGELSELIGDNPLHWAKAVLVEWKKLNPEGAQYIGGMIHDYESADEELTEPESYTYGT